MTTDNLPTQIDQKELDAFINENRVSASDLLGSGDYLPQLKVNYMDEIDFNGEKRDIKPGQFTISGQEIPSFAKNVKFRPLLHTYQYIKYNKDEEKVECRSVLFNDFSDEVRDEFGTLRCGKPESKVLRNNPSLKKQYEDTNIYRSVDGLVSYEGIDPAGNKVVVENVLCTFRGKGANFMPFAEEFLQVMPKTALLWDYELTLSVTKHKQDPKSAVNYYVVHFESDFKNKLPLTPEVFETVKELKKRIDDTNKEINKKYYSAVASRQEEGDFDEAAKVIDADLNEDFTDEAPF